ncbi:MAG: DUF1287 domain-containing protein [Pseudomonadota bacterium]
MTDHHELKRRAAGANWLYRVARYLGPGVALLAVFGVPNAQTLDSARDERDPLVIAARERTEHPVTYDGSYRSIAYPMGDVPNHIGVCSDVIVRAYRALGIDLQRRVHEDMRSAFRDYPDIWGLKRPDANIDHRRVPNLERYFSRHNAALMITTDPRDYAPGDVVSWRLPSNLPHIGIVSDRVAPGTNRPLIIHNIGAGPVEEDMLFRFKIHGHFRYRE